MGAITNFISTVVEVFNPRAALKREVALKQIEAVRSFEAAGGGRRTAGWKAINQVSWEEVSRDLSKLRARSIDLANNNPWAKKAVEVIANNTVGTGIRASIKGKAVQAKWKAWAETTACDFDGHFSFYGLQRHIWHTVAKSGECLVVRRRVKGRLELQVLEGMFLDQGRNLVGMNGNSIYTIDGVEFSGDGKRVAYWIYETNPLVYRGLSKRIPAEDVIHVFEVLRPGQVRGVPFGVASMLRLRDFDEFEDAQLLRQKIAACYAVFVSGSTETATGDPVDTNIPSSIEPGRIQELSAGTQVTFSSPPGAEGYGPYSRNVLLGVSAGYGVPYEALTGDLSNVNFSSGRMGWVEFGRNITHWQQNILIPKLCASVWRWFREDAAVDGLRVPEAVDWTAPKREMIDPAKEFAAMADAIRNGLITYPEALRQLGYDMEATLAEIEESNKALDAKSIKIVSDPRYFPMSQGPMMQEDSPQNPKIPAK